MEVAEVIKLVVVIAVIIISIVIKWRLEYAIFCSSLLLGVFYGVNSNLILKTFFLTLIDESTLRLVGIVILVYLFSGILNKIESLANLVSSLRGLFKDYRFIMAIVPALLGLIPMPAGAIFSAPMVKEVGEESGLTSEENTFINYWFRHIWEPILPLIPSLLLFITLLKVDIRDIVRIQFPLFITAVITGLIWEYKNLRPINRVVTKESILFNLKKLWLCIWPIIFILVLVMVVKIDILVSLVVVIFILWLVNIKRLNCISIKKIIRKSFDLEVLALVTGVMFFQKMLITSRAIEVIPGVFTRLSISIPILIFSVPLVIGVITGLSSATFGITIPLLLPIMMIKGEVNLYYAMLFFTGQFIGLMLSPLHLCLIVTRDYFKADLGQVYKMMAFPLVSIALVAFIQVIIHV